MYGTSVCFPTSAEVKQPSLGADPPFVFKRWMKVVLLSSVPPVGPSFAPTVCSNRQAIEPVFGQLVGSEPARIMVPLKTAAHTLLLSNELCHVALPKGTGCVGSMGFSFGLRKWVTIWKFSPPRLRKSVASGRAALTVHEAVEAPGTVGRQTYP